MTVRFLLIAYRYTSTSLLLLICLLAVPTPCHAYSLMESYMAPEARYQRELQNKISVPDKLNINQASLNQLKSLPGIDDNLALKLMRIRPIEDVKDFQRIQWVPALEIQQLMKNLQGKVSF